ncbi:ATP-dependent DNA helicase PIF1 [Purpureocillium lavendulum]|uniref:ATP-dependent DNA helicase PIF1 n=1 Tax=Purpureocillium lavendulum TaxID=1247861 RepID=A0AB34FH31_9HYPO|nr:ATP-dependent DNA helicase PIF1 [Purpureocillium lavendulum]
MTAYPVYGEHAAQPQQQQQQQQQPPAYTPSPGLTPSSTFDANTQAGMSNAAPPTKQPSAFNRKFHSITSKAGWPLNKAANVIGAEGWWPTSVEKECSKAARILHSFTSLGPPQPPNTDGPMHPTGITKKSMVKIPDAVLRECAGLAIFNVIRAGAFHGSLAAGSGVVVARRADGTWSPPSSFVVSTVGAGFMLGLDVYDCVCVLNTPEQVGAFTNPRVSLGGEASIAVGPVGTGGSVDAALSKTVRPMWSYMKSRGLWAGVQIDGTIIVSRADANSVFYNERGITAKKILRGDVAWPAKARPLFEVLRAIEGRQDFDRTVVQEVGRMATPGDTVLDEKPETRVQVEHREREDETLLDEKERLARAGY